MDKIVKFPDGFAAILGVAVVAILAIAVAKHVPGLKSWV